MIHHPLILGPKLVVLAIIIIVLIVLHGVLPPEQFRVAVIVAAGVFVCCSVAIWTIVFRQLRNPDSKLSKATVLSQNQRPEDGYVAPSREMDVPIGARGKAASGLRPSGIAVIERDRVSVVTTGEFIPPGAAVEVVAVKGTRVVVRELADREEEAPD
jgi:membrane-bound serine protease (ClpP class)